MIKFFLCGVFFLLAGCVTVPLSFLPSEGLAVVVRCKGISEAMAIAKRTQPMAVVWVIDGGEYWCVWGGSALNRFAAERLQADLWVQYRIKSQVKKWLY